VQLNPTIPLSPQLDAYSSTSLEQLTAAACASTGFTVMRSVLYEMDGQSVAEVDVFASQFSPWRESRIIFECKGGHPSFQDIRKSASLKQLLTPAPDDIVFLCKKACPANRKKLAELLDTRIIEKNNLTYYILPLIGGAPLREERSRFFNRFLAWQLVHDFLVSKASAHAKSKQHLRFLTSQLWKVHDPQEQLKLSFDEYTNQYSDTSDVVAAAKGTTKASCLRSAPDDEVEATFYIHLLHRMMNIYAVVRMTQLIVQHQSPAHLIRAVGPNLRHAVNELSSYPRLMPGLLPFAQHFIYRWGGFLVNAKRDYEIGRIAEEIGASTDAVELYLGLIKRIYSGSSTNLFCSMHGLSFIKYVPASVRALGMEHRRALDPTGYSTVGFFGTSESAYEGALDRALVVIGGRSGLFY
jgi:hypothetical protein